MSRLNHCFAVEHAEKYGVECAIIIHHFQFWVEQNKRLGKNLHEGKTWIYQTQKEIAAVYPYWSEDVVYKLLKKMVDKGILIKGNFNKSQFDRTQWYAFNEENLFSIPSNDGMDSVETRNPNRKTTESIYDIDAKPDAKKTTTLPPPKKYSKPSKEIGGGFFDCLKEIDIKSKDKTRLSSLYPEDLVKKVLAHVSHSSFKPQKSLDASIFYFCKNPDHITPNKEEIQKQKQSEKDKEQDIQHERKRIAEKISHQINKQIPIDKTNPNWSWACISSNEYLQINGDREDCRIYYSDKSFKEKIKHYLTKFCYPIPSIISELRI